MNDDEDKDNGGYRGRPGDRYFEAFKIIIFPCLLVAIGALLILWRDSYKMASDIDIIRSELKEKTSLEAHELTNNRLTKLEESLKFVITKQNDIFSDVKVLNAVQALPLRLPPKR